MIFRYFVILLIFSIVVLSGIVQYTYAVSVIAVTDNGSSFPIILESSLYGNSTGTGDSILDGLGVYLTIQNIGSNGMVYFGEGDNTGEQTDIRAYVEVGNNDDWVIAITDDDYTEVLAVPEFGVQYEYVSGSLINVTNTEPNILGYSDERILSGSIIVTTSNEGIFFSGDGELILKLHDYSNQSLLLRGYGSSDNVIKIITSDFDLINNVYYSDGYLTYSNSIDPVENSFSVTAGIDSTHTGVLTFDAYAFYNGNSCTAERDSENYGRVVKMNPDPCLYKTINRPSISTTLVKTNNVDHYTITGDSTTVSLMTMWNWYYGDPFAYDQWNDNFYFEIYDTLPSVQLAGFSEELEGVLEFPIQQTYLYVKLDGGNSNIKGESFDPDEDVFFYVDGLPSDMAYDISKSGIVGAVGKTSSTGVISLLAEDVDFGISSSPGGILKIYPDSISHVGDFGIVMVDVLHDSVTILPVGDDLLYIPQNYVYWVFPVQVEFENVMIDDIAIDYLNKNYTKNEAVLIPVIPGANTIYATINGEDVEILMRDVATTTQTKQVPIESSTTSDYMVDGTAATSSNISTSTFLTATHTGTMYVNLDFQVGGAVEFSMDSTYTGGFSTSQSCKWHGASSPSRSYSCSTYSTPSNPSSISNIDTLTAEHQTQLTTALNNGQLTNLTVEVDIIRNMGENDDVESFLIYTSNSAQAYVTSTLSVVGYGASNQVYVTYPMTTVTGNIAIPVTVGDMMEFVVRVNLGVSGAPVPASESASYTSYVQATTELGGGIISVGMS